MVAADTELPQGGREREGVGAAELVVAQVELAQEQQPEQLLPQSGFGQLVRGQPELRERTQPSSARQCGDAIMGGVERGERGGEAGESVGSRQTVVRHVQPAQLAQAAERRKRRQPVVREEKIAKLRHGPKDGHIRNGSAGGVESSQGHAGAVGGAGQLVQAALRHRRAQGQRVRVGEARAQRRVGLVHHIVHDDRVEEARLLAPRHLGPGAGQPLQNLVLCLGSAPAQPGLERLKRRRRDEDE
mmetsp:Transcript_30606/g.98991  ORF Transcript_30606/g.98991 Transcript_30606/m.98991 type:complete len:244 (+) Transcript_30606:518-1249(+)